MKRLYVSLFTLACALVMIGCSSNNEEAEEVNAEAEKNRVDQESEEVVQELEETEEAEEAQEEAVPESDVDFSGIIKEMEDITEGEAEVIFGNGETDKKDIQDVHVSLNSYVLTELNDFHTNFEIPFDDHTDGGVILAHYTVKNDRDEDVHYTPFFDMSYTGYTRTRSNQKQLLPEEVQLNKKLGPSNDYELPQGEERSGYVAYALSPEELDEILEQGEVEIEVPAAAENYDSETFDYKPLIGEASKFKVAISDEGSKKVAESGKFYEDKVTYDNMGEKTMIKEKDGMEETVTLRDSSITLEGYQFTEFEPNEVEAPRFEDFDEGVVLLTVKMEVENNESEDVGLSLLNSKLEVNDGKQYMLNENMLVDYSNNDVIEAGSTGDWLQVFVLDKEQYEKIWKDKTFELEVGPLKGTEAGDLSKGQQETFVLPE